jgi:IclR helix-turn-helix domain
MPPPRDVQPRDRIAGLEKGLQVIAAFDDDRARQTIADVAAHCGLTLAAARHYLITLMHLGYADSDGKLFSLTPKVQRQRGPGEHGQAGGALPARAAAHADQAANPVVKLWAGCGRLVQTL